MQKLHGTASSRPGDVSGFPSGCANLDYFFLKLLIDLENIFSLDTLNKILVDLN
jgi:hypothetical protein